MDKKFKILVKKCLIFDIPSRIYPIPSPTEKRIVLFGTKYKEWFFSEQIWAFYYFLQAGLFLKIPTHVNWERASGFFSDKFIIRVNLFLKTLMSKKFNSHKKLSPLPMQNYDPYWKTNLKYENRPNLKLQIPIANCLYKIISINNLFKSLMEV